MLHLKQILLRNLDRSLRTISSLKTDFELLGVAHQNFQYQVRFGMILSSLKLLGLIMIFLTVTFTLNLWSLMQLMWTKCLVPLWNIARRALKSLYTSCRLAVTQTSIKPTSNKSQSSQWKEDGDTPQGSTLTSSETPGELNENIVNKIRRYM